METFIMYHAKTKEIIRIEKAESPASLIKKYDLCTKENINVKITEASLFNINK